MQATNGQNGQPQPVAIIQIALMPDGSVPANFSTADGKVANPRLTFNGMVETAKQQILGQLIKAEVEAASKKIVMPDALMSASDLRN